MTHYPSKALSNMALDTVTQIFLKNLPSQANVLSIERHRQAIQDMNKLAGVPKPVKKIIDTQIPGPYGDIPARIYIPLAEAPHPCLLFLYGGGFIGGDLNAQDILCQQLCHDAQCAILNISYKLAPAYKFPVAFDEVYATVLWLAESSMHWELDPKRIAIGGVSSGANLAATVAIKAKQMQNSLFAGQILIVPVVDMSLSFPSCTEFATGYFFELASAKWMLEQYLPDTIDLKDPRVSPYWEADLSQLPEALIITAECDPLRDEAEAYAKRLRDANVETTCVRHEGAIHPFFCMGNLFSQAAPAQQEVVKFLNKIFNR